MLDDFLALRCRCVRAHVEQTGYSWCVDLSETHSMVRSFRLGGHVSNRFTGSGLNGRHRLWPVTSFAVAVALALAGACTGSHSNKETSGAASSERTPLTVKEIVGIAKGAVVRVESEVGVGTGFVLSEDGRIATNLHVIAGASAIKVALADERTFNVERVLAIDPMRDLALLKVSASGLETVRLGDSDLAAAGDPIVVIGNPLGVLDFTVSDGLVSSVRVSEDVKVIQTSAPISQGSSGGPLFNNFGEVIGIATFFAREGQNLNFAIPSNYLKPMLREEGGLNMEEFAERFRRSSEIRTNGLRPTIPLHELTLLDGCSAEQMRRVEEGITNAISLGAPVYNRGDREACYVIYRSAAQGFEADDSMCKGVRDAFGRGLLVADGKKDFTEKAWAMRDAFDGLLIVFNRKR